jgi:hypothetical protein
VGSRLLIERFHPLGRRVCQTFKVEVQSQSTVNYAFMEHFQDVARGHFTVRRLERVYGKERVRAEYNLIAAAL